MKFFVKKTTQGKAFLNFGCGSVFHADWNNIDLLEHKDVLKWDIRKDLPYPNNSFDFAYSSHVLEHMSLEDAAKLLGEIFRIMKPGAILRTAVPDLERICKEYITNIDAARQNPSAENIAKYDWIKIELMDQMTRKKSGGYMRQVINSANSTLREYIVERIGDAGSGNKEMNGPKRSIIQKIFGKAQSLLRKNDPGSMGELHLWMYDSFSLGIHLKKIGFKEASVKRFDESSLPEWRKYNFDASKMFPGKARKPDSLYMEAIK